jgi:hypothetical protein
VRANSRPLAAFWRAFCAREGTDQENRARSFRQRHGRSKASKIKMIDNQNSTRGSGCCRNLMSLPMLRYISFASSAIMEAQANRPPQHVGR